MTTPKERAADEVQGDELSRYQRMFLEQDIEREITEAVKDLLEQNAALHALIRRVIDHCPFCQNGTCRAETHAWLREALE